MGVKIKPLYCDDQFDAAADAMRKRIVHATIAERESAIFRNLSDSLEMSVILVGGLAAVVGALLCTTRPEGHDELMKAVAAYLPHARANIAVMLETGA